VRETNIMHWEKNYLEIKKFYLIQESYLIQGRVLITYLLITVTNHVLYSKRVFA